MCAALPLGSVSSWPINTRKLFLIKGTELTGWVRGKCSKSETSFPSAALVFSDRSENSVQHCFFRRDISVIFYWDILVIYLRDVLKLAVTVFFSLYFQTFWPKWLNFFWSFRKHFGLWPKKRQCNGLRRRRLQLYRHTRPARATEVTCTSWGLNRNWRFKLLFSIVSMSVTTMPAFTPVSSPASPPFKRQPRPIMQKFLSSSQPIAPAPTTNQRCDDTFFWNSRPNTATWLVYRASICGEKPREMGVGLFYPMLMRCLHLQLVGQRWADLVYDLVLTPRG